MCLSILECKIRESKDLILSTKAVPGSSKQSKKYSPNEWMNECTTPPRQTGSVAIS